MDVTELDVVKASGRSGVYLMPNSGLLDLAGRVVSSGRNWQVKYVEVRWLHSSEEYPVVYLSELGDDDYEVRKVQIFRDGRSEWADEFRETESVGLSEIPFPSLGEISGQRDFTAEEITGAEFERAWVAAREG
ncbi:hypothetical protein [Actinosynnema sp. NPDC020468]|uniref:DUF6881 domain-containing protein n=1 Tax=Actinosynnema sp. NPDC020468 TaxID=3154488 RepID=UPI00340C4107